MDGCGYGAVVVVAKWHVSVYKVDLLLMFVDHVCRTRTVGNGSGRLHRMIRGAYRWLPPACPCLPTPQAPPLSPDAAGLLVAGV